MPVLKKYNSDTTQWEPVAIGSTGPTGPQGVIGETGPTGPTGPTGATGDWSTPQAIITQTTTYTLTLTDAGKIIKCSNATPIDIVIPTNASVAFEIGQKIDILQYGAGQVSIVGASGVLVVSTPTNKTRTQNSFVSCIKIGTNEWVLTGDLSLS